MIAERLASADVRAAIEVELDGAPTLTGADCWRRLRNLPGVPRYSAFMRLFGQVRDAQRPAPPRPVTALRRRAIAEAIHAELESVERRLLSLLDTP